ncbi:hypothetical protein ACU4GI_47105 (plasmid) [Cupriavidus basilensis]
MSASARAGLVCLLLGVCISLPPVSGVGYALLPFATESTCRKARFGRAIFVFLGAAWCVAASAYASGASWWLAFAVQSCYAVVMAAPALLPGQWWFRGAMQLLLPSLPPFAYWLPLPPLAGAGWLFPGAGYVGIALYVSVALAIAGWRYASGAMMRTLAACLVASGLLVVGLNLRAISDMPMAVAGWHALQFRPAPPVPSTFEEAAFAMIRLADTVDSVSYPVVIAPENWLGTLPLAAMRRLQMALQPGQELLVGGIRMQDGMPRKGVWHLPEGTFTPAIAPIPLIEPYGADYTRTGSVIKVAGHPVSLLVCFEGSTSLPLYHLHYGMPVILVANGWWDRLGALSIQRSVARSWARLFASMLLISEASR